MFFKLNLGHISKITDSFFEDVGFRVHVGLYPRLVLRVCQVVVLEGDSAVSLVVSGNRFGLAVRTQDLCESRGGRPGLRIPKQSVRPLWT